MAYSVFTMKNYLKEIKTVNLSERCINNVEITRNCFELIRDDISHSGDIKDPGETSVKASEVLGRALVGVMPRVFCWRHYFGQMGFPQPFAIRDSVTANMSRE